LDVCREENLEGKIKGDFRNEMGGSEDKGIPGGRKVPS